MLECLNALTNFGIYLSILEVEIHTYVIDYFLMTWKIIAQVLA